MTDSASSAIPGERPCGLTQKRQRILNFFAVGATALALLATTEPPPLELGPPSYLYTYALSLEVPDLVLDSAEPSVTVRIRFSAKELSPNGLPTTERSSLGLSGTLTQPGAVADAGAGQTRLVRIAVSAPAASGAPVVDPAAAATVPQSSQQRVLTQFSLAASPHFQGDCADLSDPASPCEALVDVTFEREDGGASGDDVQVQWELAVSSLVAREADAKESLELPLPWEVTFEQP